MMTQHRGLLRGIVLLLVGSYALAWVSSSSAGLTLNAYDLAEWSNLHPFSREAQPALWQAFLLRAQLVILVCLVLLTAPAQRGTWLWWLHIIFALVLTISQLPPAEFLANQNDPNQRQQFILALMSLVAIFSFGIRQLPDGLRNYANIALFILLGTTSLLAYTSSLGLMRAFNLMTAPLPGFVLYIVFALVGIGISVRSARAAWQRPS